jgi:Galactose oxidase, central domain
MVPSRVLASWIFAALATAGVACGSGATTPAPAPTLLARRSHVMSYDAVRRHVMLFGGVGPATPALSPDADQASLWEFDGTGWSEVTATGGPAARNSAAAAFDLARGRLLVFGGRIGTAPDSPAFGDAWEWDGTAWSRGPMGGPSARVHAAAGYDGARQRVVVVGGFDPATGTDLTDQFDFLGTGWAPLGGAVPAGGFGPTLVSEEPTGAGLLLIQSRQSDRKVEVYRMSSPGEWQLVSSTGPRCSGFAAATLPGGGGVLLFGGSDGAGVLADTWRWDGASWYKLPISGPAGRVGHAMALDVARGRIVLFGGESDTERFGDTWEFDGVSWHQVAQP